MSLLTLLNQAQSVPAGPPSGVVNLPVSWIAQAVMPNDVVLTTSKVSFAGDEVSRVTYVAGQV